MSPLYDLIKTWRSGDYSVAHALWDCLQEEGMPWEENHNKNAFPYVLWQIWCPPFWFADINQESYFHKKQTPYVTVYNGGGHAYSYPLAGDEAEANLKERANLAIYAHLMYWYRAD